MVKFYDYKLIDQKVCILSSSIEANLLSYINPTNLEQQQKKFFEAIQNDLEYNPSFTYLSKNPIYSYFSLSHSFSTYKKELLALLPLLGEDSLGLIFEKKIEDLLSRIELIRSIATENFSGNAESYYGLVGLNLLHRAKEILSKKPLYEDSKISLDDAKKQIDSFLKKKKLKYKVFFRNPAGSKYAVNINAKLININNNISFSKGELKRLIAHEIEGHVYRYENGFEQPYKIFSKGLSKEMLETEEGVAVTVEMRQGINVDSQLFQYAGRVLAVHLASKNDFFKTFSELRTYFDEEDSFLLTLRAKRGTFHQDRGGAFTKDILYLKGMLVVEDFLKDGKLEDLYYGRYAVSDVPLVKDVDGLKKPKYLPEF